MRASQNCSLFWSISSTFSVSPGVCIRFLSSDFGNHCNSHGNHMCLVNYCHRNACSVLCFGVGTRLANHYLVMGDFTVGTMFTQPLAGNVQLHRLRNSGFVGRNVDNLSCMSYISHFNYHRPILSTTNHQAPQLTDVTTNEVLWVISINNILYI
jgi:hypothetical protein